MNLLANFAGGILNWLISIFSNNYILAIIAFTIFMRVILVPINMLNKKVSSKNHRVQAKVLKINQHAVKNNISSSVTGDKIAELYKHEHFTYFNLLVGPMISILSMFLLFGLIKAVFSPLTYVLKIPTQEIAALIHATSGGSELAVFSEFDNLKSVFMTLVNPESVNSIQHFRDGMMIGDINLTLVPTVHYLIALPVIALIVFLISNGIGYLYNRILKNHTSHISLIVSGVTVVMYCLFVFRAPAILCVYWITSSILSISIQTFQFLKIWSKRKNSPQTHPNTEESEEDNSEELIKISPEEITVEK